MQRVLRVRLFDPSAPFVNGDVADVEEIVAGIRDLPWSYLCPMGLRRTLVEDGQVNTPQLDDPPARRGSSIVSPTSDYALALGLLLLSGAVVLWGGDLTESLRIPTWPMVAVLQCGGLVFRRSMPLVALVLVWVGALVQVALVQEVGPESVAILVVLYSSAAHGSRVARIVGLVSVLVGGLVAGWFLAISVPYAEGRPPGSLLFLTSVCVMIFFISWLLGVLRVVSARATRDRIEASIAAEQAQHAIAVEEERARIARDVHDVVAHSLAVMVAQAEGARMVAEARGADSGPLTAIADAGRAALAEVRSVLTELRDGERDTPQPSLARLEGVFSSSYVHESRQPPERAEHRVLQRVRRKTCPGRWRQYSLRAGRGDAFWEWGLHL